MIRAHHLPESRPCTTVRLFIKARKIADRDVLSKSDPICIVYEKTSGKRESCYAPVVKNTFQDPEWIERGRTEMIKNNLNPEFTRNVTLSYYFEETQLLRFELYDVDSHNVADLTKHDFLGRYECPLARIVSFTKIRGHLEIGPDRGKLWKDGDDFLEYGSITIRGEEDNNLDEVSFDVEGENLDKKMLMNPDPYLVFIRHYDDGNSHPVYTSELKRSTRNPFWKRISIAVQALCGKDHNAPITIECYDKGQIRKLKTKKKQARKGRSYQNSGILILSAAKIVKQHSFLDYIAGGTQLEFSIAIDFTASNGPIRDPRSLHYLFKDRPNQYEIAIKACLAICQYYNYSKTFDVYGFGARLPHERTVSSLFNLNYLEKSPSVTGIRGVARAYRNALSNVELFGPSNFTPVIKCVADKASDMMADSSRYQILLIITDGEITDMNNTIDTIINASSLPLSIIIIGVGNDEFNLMEMLDSDDHLLRNGATVAQRDIVQFVRMRSFLNEGGTYLDPDIVMQNLAREVLYEVPAQLTSYMKSRGFTPKPANSPWPRPQPPPEYDEAMDNLALYESVSPPPPPIGFNVERSPQTNN
ncbi:unnamed protein product [Caenorhabditis bovis]|uniref:C2 domain-containing protein n=1 Tax=Caenorhabditis bovis TaxID=2654633 RepID=A0A8S1EWR2_9PELO|nr:unnamed protein product [Caenorhabditis bovis]